MSKKEPFYLGGIASMVAACFTHPLDLMKVRLQTEISNPVGLYITTTQIWEYEGVKGFYKGLSASLLRQATYSSVRFGVYEKLKLSFTTEDKGFTLPKKVFAAMASGILGGISGNPADVVNVRMQADGKLPKHLRRNYSSALDGLKRIFKEEGYRSLMNGVFPNIQRSMLMTAGQLSSYDQAKEFFISNEIVDDGVLCHFLSSFVAGFVATTIVAPIDVMKTRLMNSEKGTFTSQADCALQIVKVEGFWGFYKGFMPSWVRLGPHTIITFLVLEKLKSFF